MGVRSRVLPICFDSVSRAGIRGSQEYDSDLPCSAVCLGTAQRRCSRFPRTGTLHTFGLSHASHLGVIIAELLRYLHTLWSYFSTDSFLLSWPSLLLRAPRAAVGWSDWLRFCSSIRSISLYLYGRVRMECWFSHFDLCDGARCVKWIAYSVIGWRVCRILCGR